MAGAVLVVVGGQRREVARATAAALGSDPAAGELARRRKSAPKRRAGPVGGAQAGPAARGEATEYCRARGVSRSLRSPCTPVARVSEGWNMRHVGVREFKDRANALLNAGEPLVIERRGRAVGAYIPF